MAGAGAAPEPARLGVADGALMVMGSVVGAGIFLTSGVVAEHVASPAVFLGLWFVGGLVALSGALCNGELGALFPRSGGEYVYLREAYGPAWGFLSGWTSFWVGFPGSIATLAAGFAQATCGLLGLESHATVALVALVSIALLTGVDARGLAVGKRLQNALSFSKFVVFAALLASVALVPRTTSSQALPSTLGADSWRDLGVALLPILFTYSGWNVATYVAGELRDARRNLGRALVLGTAACVVLYLAVNAAYLHVLSLDHLRGMAEPAKQTFARVGPPGASLVLSLLIALSILSSLDATIIAGPRIAQAMAEDGLLFPGLRQLHPRTLVPARALWVQAGVAAVLVASGTFEELLTFTTFVLVLFSALTVLAVALLRRTRPHAKRAFSTPLYPLPVLVFVGAEVWVLWAVLASGARAALAGLAIVAAGVPVYLRASRRRSGR